MFLSVLLTCHPNEQRLPVLFVYYSFRPHSCYCLIVPHKQFWIFFEHVIWDFFSDGNNCCIVAILPGFFEPCADGFEAENLVVRVPFQ